MHINESKADRMLRIILGIVVIALGVYYNSYWGFLGFVFLLTGTIGFCPIYRVLGIGTTRAGRTT